MRAFVIGAIATINGKHLWWADPELGTSIEWTLVPRDQQAVHQARRQEDVLGV